MADLSGNGVLAQGSADNNIFTELAAGLYQKKEWSDEAGSVQDSNILYTAGNFLAPRVVGGTTTETGDAWEIRGIALNEIGVVRPDPAILTFDEGVFETQLTNQVNDNLQFIYFGLWKDSNNYAYLRQGNNNAGSGNFRAFLYLAGATVVNVTSGLFISDGRRIRITRSNGGADWEWEYTNNSDVWQTLATYSGADMGGGLAFENVMWKYSGTVQDEIDFEYLRATGTGVYWPTGTTQLNSVVADNGAGAVIQFGSFNPTEVGTVTYDLKIGSAGFLTNQTKANIIALGDQVTDTGAVQLYINLAGGSGQSSVADNSLVVPDVISGGAALGAYQHQAYASQFDSGAWR